MHLCLDKFSKPVRSGSVSLIAVALCGFLAFAQSPSDWGVPGDIRVQGSFSGGVYLDYAVWRPSNGTWYVFPSEFPSNNFADYHAITVQLGLAGDVPVPADYDDDFLTDFAVWRPSNGIWYIRSSKTGLVSEQQWGLPGDIPIPGTFAVTGQIDLAVWRPSNGNWYILPGDGSAPYTVQLGLPGDIPVVGDFDGDQIQDMAVWSPANALWYVRLSSHPNGPPMIMQWGLPGDIPVPGDYDEDGKTDFAVWRPSNQNVYVLPSSNPQAAYTQQVNSPLNILATKFDVGGLGAGVYINVIGDFDGDGQLDFAVWKPSSGTWFVVPSDIVRTQSTITLQFGLPGDVPVPGNYPFGSQTDFAVWRPSNGTWYKYNASTPAAPTITVWGQAGDIPLVGAYNSPSVTNYSVWRPSNGVFYILGVNTPSQSLAVGLPGEIPIFGNFTYPEGQSDLAAWDPSTGNWFVDPTLQSGDNYPFEKQWGLPGDFPIAGDFNGDGLTDYAVWRPTESNLYVMLNASGATYVQELGVVGNIPFYGQPPLTNYTPYTPF